MKRNIKFCCALLVCMFFVFSAFKTAEAEVKLIDDFKGQENLLGGKSNVYQQEPSRAYLSRKAVERDGKSEMVLMIKYDKKNKGGSYDSGGWCGYYTLLKTDSTYFDISKYKNLTLWVKGAQGDENFKVGLADRHWEQADDSVKSDQIGAYLKAGKITTDWQKATIPLNLFLIDFTEMSSLAICFESECFPDGSGMGTVYIDDIALE
ncbi:MAG: carbohydrate binding domain-containing protein [Candidatus Omnitrophota bacterium]